MTRQSFTKNGVIVSLRDDYPRHLAEGVGGLKVDPDAFDPWVEGAGVIPPEEHEVFVTIEPENPQSAKDLKEANRVSKEIEKLLRKENSEAMSESLLLGTTGDNHGFSRIEQLDTMVGVKADVFAVKARRDVVEYSFADEIARNALNKAGFPEALIKPDVSEMVSDKEMLYTVGYIPHDDALAKDDTTLGITVVKDDDVENHLSVNILFDIKKAGNESRTNQTTYTSDFDMDRIVFAKRVADYLSTAVMGGYMAELDKEIPRAYDLKKVCVGPEYPHIADHVLVFNSRDHEWLDAQYGYLNRLVRDIEEKGLDKAEEDMVKALNLRPRGSVDVKSRQKSGERLLDRRAVEEVMNELQRGDHLKEMDGADFMRLTDQIHRRLTGEGPESPGKK